MTTILLLTLASLAAGFVDAVAGGGGVITVPALIMAGLPVPAVVGTNKFVSVSGTTVAAWTFLRRGYVQGEVIRTAWPFTMAGALLGAATVLVLPNAFLRPLVSVLVILVAVYCFFRPALGQHNDAAPLTSATRNLTRLAGLALGFYDGFFGPGTGIFLTFFFVGVLQCDFLRATANTKILNWMSNIVPLAYFLFQGIVRFDLGLPMLAANVLGGYLGARTAIARGSAFIKWIYLAMAAMTAGKLIVDMLGA